MEDLNRHIKPNWKYSEPLESRGVLIASDSNHEWMIPWWWYNYKQHNDYPVTIIDLGMSERARKSCQKIGTVLNYDYHDVVITPKKFVPENLQAIYKKKFHIEDFWKIRKAWFKKPFTMLQSPFHTTIWMDIDCEVKGSLQHLFESHECQPGFRIALEDENTIDEWVRCGVFEKGEVIYNSGVVVYTHGHDIFIDWAKETMANNHVASGDQDALCSLLRKKKHTILQLPDIYNWRMKKGKNPEAIIIHWVADRGKSYISNQIESIFFTPK